jgi:diguanylate cyclase (GGDEF)-like protein
VEQEIARYERYGGNFSLMIFDLDSFKEVNDVYGHLAGDIVQKKVASTCLEELRKSIQSVGSAEKNL